MLATDFGNPCTKGHHGWWPKFWLPTLVLYQTVNALMWRVHLEKLLTTWNVSFDPWSFMLWSLANCHKKTCIIKELWKVIFFNRYHWWSYWWLQWRHNEPDWVSNHQPHDCLLNRLFRLRSKKTSKLRVTGLCEGIHRGPVNSPHKWPVAQKMFPFDDVIMSSVRDCSNSIANALELLQSCTKPSISSYIKNAGHQCSPQALVAGDIADYCHVTCRLLSKRLLKITYNNIGDNRLLFRLLYQNHWLLKFLGQ